MIIFGNTMSSPLLTEIAADVNTDVAMAGYMPTVITLFMGISLMGSTVVVERFGVRKSMAFGMFLVTAGNLSSLWAQSLTALLAGRAFVGIGMGIQGTGFSTISASWFPQGERSVFATVYTLANSLMTYVCFAVTIPMYQFLGNSWRCCYVVISVIYGIIMIMWLVLGRDGKSNGAAGKGREKGGLLLAVRRKDVWILSGFNALATLGANMITNYYPSYLQIVRGIDAGTASRWSGYVPLAGIVGTLAGGAISTAIGRRRPVFIPGAVMTGVSMFFCLVAKVPAAVIVSVILFGFASRYKIPAMTTATTEMKDSIPAMAAGAYALMYGVGSVIGAAAPKVLSGATIVFGMETAMLIFAGITMGSVIFAFFVKETGPGKGGRHERKRREK